MFPVVFAAVVVHMTNCATNLAKTSCGFCVYSDQMSDFLMSLLTNCLYLIFHFRCSSVMFPSFVSELSPTTALMFPSLLNL